MSSPSHVQREIGQALATELSAYSFAGAITAVDAVYRRRADYQLEDLGGLKVSVVPGPVGVGPTGDVPQAPRGMDFMALTYGVVVAKHVGSESDIEACEDLMQAIMDAIRSDHLDLGEGVDWIDFGQPVPFDMDSLEDRNVFLSQVEVTYMVPVQKLPAPTPPGP
jgi:hypothetical protein